MQDWSKEASMPKTSSVRPDISIELQLVTDINTNRHRAMVVPAIA